MKLASGVSIYTGNKRKNGLSFQFGELTLSALGRFCGDVEIDDVSQAVVARYLKDRPISAVTYRLKHGVLRCFFEYWAARGVIPEFQMPPNAPLEYGSYVPHIFTRDEIKRLIQLARLHVPQQRCSIAPRTLQTMIITAYATGAIGGELVTLRTTDVDLKRGRVTFYTSRIRENRTVPIGRDLLDVLNLYEGWKRRKGLQSESFFSRINGEPISTAMLCRNLGRLRKRAEIVASGGSNCRARIRDLRTTFSVHRLTAWIETGRDLKRMLPALATYLGFVELSSTEHYLFLTPERFKRGLNALSPRTSLKKWRDDPELMRFLYGL